jgi:hypothetical protein
MALPKVLYVYEMKDGDIPYYAASRVPGEQGEGIVGVYRLEDTLYVRHALELKRKGTKTWFKNAQRK